jgi:hypothetical protein
LEGFLGFESILVKLKLPMKETLKKLSPNWEECGPCPVFAGYTLAFALQLRKNQGKTDR